MTTALETNATPSIATLVSAMQDIPLDHIQETRGGGACRTDCGEAESEEKSAAAAKGAERK